MSRTIKDYIAVGFKGLAMGAADVVPGVSGGTIAFISGIYEELVVSISNINFSLLKTLQKEGFKVAWKQLNGSFLAALFIGVLISILSLAKTIKYLLENEPILLWSFFFGLVMASIIFIGKQVEKWNYKLLLLAVFGAAFGYTITIVSSTSITEINYLFLVFAGAIASCAMILPGISGSYILLLMGVYPIVMTAITNRDVKIISAIGVGVVLGLLFFSKLLKWLFSKYKNEMLVVLTGIMFGSLNKVWPWKITVTTYLNSHGETKPLLEQSISPFSFDGDPQLMLSILLALTGFFIIIAMERVAKLKK
jgi:putative membrane protein